MGYDLNPDPNRVLDMSETGLLEYPKEVNVACSNHYNCAAQVLVLRLRSSCGDYCGFAAAQVLVLRQSRSCSDYCGFAAAQVLV